MGYLTRVNGRIAITPPLPWGAIRDSAYISTDDCPFVGTSVAIHVETERTETDEGTLTVRTGTAITGAHGDGGAPYKAYDIVEDLQKVIDQFGEGRTFTGYLQGEGEDPGDLWRLYVVNGRAVEVKPTIVWPDPTVGGAE